MELNIRPVTAAESQYFYNQSQQIRMQCGSIGYLRGDFSVSGNQFYSTWTDLVQSRKTDEFKQEFDNVINALRSDPHYDGLLKDRASMAAYCRKEPLSVFNAQNATDMKQYGFRADTEQYAYLLRCAPYPGHYDIYLYPHISSFFDRHLKNAEQGIRFITSDYKELFRIPDGGSIKITDENGASNIRQCRFIDECHVEVGSELLHICQFAEIMERNGRKYEPAEQASQAVSQPKKRTDRGER